jgi:ABC-type uncharacterized transport system substrate-binding protein
MRRRELLLMLATGMMGSRAVCAQQKAMPVIGYLAFGTPDSAAPLVAAFRQGLGETGYVEGQNVAIEFRGAEGDYGQLPVLAADLVARKVDVIVATAQSALARRRRRPGRWRPVGSLARPGGNLTGFSSLAIELNPKRLELLSELVPQASVIGLLVNPINPSAERIIRVAQEAARAKGVQLLVLKAPKARSTPLSRPSSSCTPARASS